MLHQHQHQQPQPQQQRPASIGPAWDAMATIFSANGNMCFYDYSNERCPRLEAQWEGVKTDWDWGYPEQQQQVGDLMAALLPSNGAEHEFQEVSRRRRKDNADHSGVDNGYHAHVVPPSHAVTVDEMKSMSTFAPKVPEPVMLRLEQLSEEGCNLAAMLDDRAWSALAALSLDDGLQVIGQVSGQLTKTPQQIRNVNAVLMSHAGKHLREQSTRLAGMSGMGPPSPPMVGSPQHQSQHSGQRAAAMNGAAMQGAKKGGSARASSSAFSSKREAAGNLGALSPEVQRKAHELMSQFGPYLMPQHFDNGIVSVLKQMGDANAQLALEAVKASCSGRGARDWSKLANPSAYIMSIISPYIRKAR